MNTNTVKTYPEGERFPGRIGRTYDVSEPAFPMPPSAPEGAPNILYIVIDDIGCDKGSPVTDEYKAQASFTGSIIQVTVDVSPDLAFDAEKHTAAQVKVAMVRQ